jgi:hypothetical protein
MGKSLIKKYRKINKKKGLIKKERTYFSTDPSM